MGLSLVSFAYADTWDKDTITVSIVDNNYNTQERIDHIEYTMIGKKVKNDSYAGWNQALNTLNGTAPQFKLVENNGDIQVNLVNYKSAKKYSAETNLESNIPRITSKGIITIYSIEDLSLPELQMLMRHELGHSLGLRHSSDSTDLMHRIIPYYTSYISPANIQNIESLYN